MLPFISEKIYQEINGEGKSVHLQDWIQYSKKSVNSKILEGMEKTRAIVSQVLKIRDLNKIPVRQPLLKLIIPGEDLGKNYRDIIAEEVNVKEVNFDKKAKDIILDLNITPQLEAEGFAREIARKIQSIRKERNMKKEDRIVLKLHLSEKLKKSLEDHIEFISKRVGATKILLDDKTEKNWISFSIKEENISFNF